MFVIDICTVVTNIGCSMTLLKYILIRYQHIYLLIAAITVMHLYPDTSSNNDTSNIPNHYEKRLTIALRTE